MNVMKWTVGSPMPFQIICIIFPSGFCKPLQFAHSPVHRPQVRTRGAIRSRVAHRGPVPKQGHRLPPRTRIRGTAARATGGMGVGARGQGVIGCCDLGPRGRGCKGPASRGSYGLRGHRGHGCELPSRPSAAFFVVTVTIFLCSLNCQPFKPRKHRYLFQHFVPVGEKFDPGNFAYGPLKEYFFLNEITSFWSHPTFVRRP